MSNETAKTPHSPESTGSETRVDVCPQCGAPVIQTNLGNGMVDDYCEECGWPDENRGAEPESPNAQRERPAEGGAECTNSSS